MKQTSFNSEKNICVIFKSRWHALQKTLKTVNGQAYYVHNDENFCGASPMESCLTAHKMFPSIWESEFLIVEQSQVVWILKKLSLF